jgi:predicted RNA methylase
MPHGTATIPDDVLDVLKASRIDGTTLYLPGEQLERSLYERVNKVIEGLGGKWNRKLRGHLFTVDPRTLYGQAVENGAYVDRKKTLQFFETPAEVARRMIVRAKIKKTDLVLEPSAGHGALLAAIDQNHPGPYITAVEVDEDNCNAVRERFPTITVVCMDFIVWAPRIGAMFGVILMNPPFHGGQDIEHVRAAWDLLHNGGRLVAILGEGAFIQQNKRAKAFRQWLEEIRAQGERLPPGTFKESGTNVAARMIWAAKGDE